MDAEIKQRWVTKLTSGDYKQGTNRLSTDDQAFCCLGVLCEIALEDQVVFKDRTGARVAYVSKLNQDDEECAVLPYAVQSWAGLDDTNPNVETPEGDSESLAELNDNGLTFEEIAKLIEKNF